MNSILRISFSRPKKWKPFSALIRWIDDSEFSHVSVSWYSDRLEREIVYQASSVMVNFCEGKHFAETHEIIEQLEIEMEPETEKRVIQWAMDRAGIPYSIKQCFGILWVKIMQKIGIKVKNPFNNGRTLYICCELAAELLELEFGYKFSEDLDLLTPKSLYNILKSHGKS